MQFFAQSKQRLELATGTPFKPSAATAAASTNVMDKWLMSTIQTLNRNVRAEMEAYHLYVPPRRRRLPHLVRPSAATTSIDSQTWPRTACFGEPDTLLMLLRE